jgi:hypothetical protein
LKIPKEAVYIYRRRTNNTIAKRKMLGDHPNNVSTMLGSNWASGL